MVIAFEVDAGGVSVICLWWFCVAIVMVTVGCLTVVVIYARLFIIILGYQTL